MKTLLNTIWNGFVYCLGYAYTILLGITLFVVPMTVIVFCFWALMKMIGG